MKEIISVIILISLIFFMPNKNYAICNTVRFTKEVSAVQLKLADGSILYDVRIDKIVNSNTPLLSNSYKDLNLIFIVETTNRIEENKDAIRSFIQDVYDFYGDSANKIKMGIIPFEDIALQTINTEIKVLKNSKQEIRNAVDNINMNSNRNLEDALRIAQTNFSENSSGGRNEGLVQCAVIITDGINDSDVCTASNAILTDLTESMMVAVYGILVNNSSQSNNNLRNLINGVPAIIIADNVAIQNVQYQLENSVLQYIEEFAIKESTVFPTGGDENTLLTPDSVILFADAEILHGAVLSIEYEMFVSRYAQYGSGAIRLSKITDHKDPKLIFNEDTRLLTDPTKTNKDYGWRMAGGGLITESTSTNNYKLVLNVIITPEGLGEGKYNNSATCTTSFDVGSGSTASYTLTDSALAVQLLPPFGNETQEEKSNIFIYGIYGIITIFIVLIAVILVKRYKTKEKSKD